MKQAITHFKVPVEDRATCLGADGSVSHVSRVLRMITGRWKLPILFRLFAEPSLRASQFMIGGPCTVVDWFTIPTVI